MGTSIASKGKIAPEPTDFRAGARGKVRVHNFRGLRSHRVCNSAPLFRASALQPFLLRAPRPCGLTCGNDSLYLR